MGTSGNGRRRGSHCYHQNGDHGGHHGAGGGSGKQHSSHNSNSKHTVQHITAHQKHHDNHKNDTGSRKCCNNSGNLQYLEPTNMKRRHSSYDTSQDDIPPPLPPHQGTVV